MDIYEELQADKIINASDTCTRIGGSRMTFRTLEAMRQTSGSFVDISELSDTICRRVAERTGNEAAFISSGAGIELSGARPVYVQDDPDKENLL